MNMLAEIKEIAQLGGTVVTVSLFLVYLYNKGQMDKETFDKFNTTINNHLDHSTKAISDNAAALQRLSSSIDNMLKRTIRKRG